MVGLYLHNTGNSFPSYIINNTGKIIQDGLKELKINERKEVKKIEWGEILTEIKSKVALQALTIQSKGSVKLTIEESLSIATLKLLSSQSSYGFGYTFNGSTTLDPSKITIEESDGFIKVVLPQIILQLSEVEFSKIATDSDTFQGKKIKIEGVPDDTTVGPVILKLQNALNNTRLLQQKVYFGLLETPKGKEILPESQKVFADHYSNLIKQIIKVVLKDGEVESPKKIKIYFAGQPSFTEITITGTNEKIVPLIAVSQSQVIEQIQSNFERDAKLDLSINPSTTIISEVKKLEAPVKEVEIPVKVEEATPSENSNNEGTELEVEK